MKDNKTKQCPKCGRWCHPNGLGPHMKACDGRRAAPTRHEHECRCVKSAAANPAEPVIHFCPHCGADLSMIIALMTMLKSKETGRCR